MSFTGQTYSFNYLIFVMQGSAKTDTLDWHLLRNAIVSFICSRNTATALCVEMWALLNPTSRRLAPGVVVSLALGCGAHISLF